LAQQTNNTATPACGTPTTSTSVAFSSLTITYPANNNAFLELTDLLLIRYRFAKTKSN
jgi:hypothetical protein